MSASNDMRQLLNIARSKNLLTETIKYAVDWRSTQKADETFFDDQAREAGDSCDQFNNDFAIVYTEDATLYYANYLDYGSSHNVTLEDESCNELRPDLDGYDSLHWFDSSDIRHVKEWLEKQTSKRPDPIIAIKTETPTKTQTGVTTMSNTKSLSAMALSANKEAMKTAATIAVGQAGNTTAKKVIVPALPMMVRGYADSMLGDVIIANLVNLAVSQFAPDNAKAVAVSQAMIDAAMIDVLGKIDIPNLIDQLTANIDPQKLTQLMSKKTDKAE